MKVFHGLKALIAARHQLPPTGWIFVDLGVAADNAIALQLLKFSVPENDEDEFFGEDHLSAWLEMGTFKGVLELREKNLARPTVAQYAEAAVHYRVHDDFLE